MSLSWTAKKQISFLFIFLAVAIAASVFIFFKLTEPTCSDGKQNQKEEGIDCGGSCYTLCLGEIKDISVIWARPLKVVGNKYDIIAIADNRNLRLRSESVKYRFKIYDERNILIATKEGETFINPGQKFAVFEHSVDVGGRLPSRVFLEFEKNIKWERQESELPSLIITDKEYSDERGPSLSAVVTNKSLIGADAVEAIAVLYAEDGNALAASATRLDELKGGASEEIFFTWPSDFEEEPVSEEILIRSKNSSEL